MSRYGSEYQVARHTGVCSATGEPLEPGSTCIATLCERAEDDSFDRKDFSLEAWNGGARPEGLFSYWKMIVPPPDAKPKMLVDDQVLMELFERLGSDERPQRIAFRFVLGLILMRKKQLKFTGRSTEDGKEYWLMQLRGPADQVPPPQKVLNPNLADDD